MSTRYCVGLWEVSSHYDIYIFDIWGVIHNGIALYPDVISCLESLKSAKKQVCFLSNSPRSFTHHERFFTALGLRRSLYDFIYTSGDALTTALDQSPAITAEDSFFFMGDDVLHQPIIEEMKGKRVPVLQEAQYILCTAPVPNYFSLLKEGVALNLPMLCSNPDRFAMHGNQKIMCAGSVAESYEKDGGKVFYCGKPERFMFESALQRLGNPSLTTILMIGDGLFTDIKGAQNMGIDSMFISGGLHSLELQKEDLESWFKKENIRPTYVLPQVRW